MAVDLTFMTIDRVVIHTVHKRSAQKTPVSPSYGTGVIRLPTGPAATLQTRITEALGQSSHGIEVSIVEENSDSFMQRGAHLIHANDQKFFEESKELAVKLAKAQANRDLAASKLFIASGRCGSAKRKYLLVIKAEMQDGFTENASGLAHLTELFLTPSQKLFKIGLLVEIVSSPPEDGLYESENFSAHLFDHLLNAQETRDAAHYFYSSFLGAQPIVSDKKLTRLFFESTKDFINTAPILQDQKVELLEALRVELRSNSAVIHTGNFAKSYLPKELRSSYLGYMDSVGFTRSAVTKNIEYVQSRLRKKQKMQFQHGVELTAPADKLHELVTIEKASANETRLIIKGAIEKQE